MSIKNIIAKGIGFTPVTIKFIPTQGFDSKSTGLTNVLDNVKSQWWWWNEDLTALEDDKNA